MSAGQAVARAHAPARRRTSSRGPELGGALPQLALVAVCAGYALGAALGWGSPQLAKVMGDFGLSAAALLAAVSCLWYARTHPGEFRPAWVLFGVSSFMICLGNAIWGWYEVVLGQPVPRTSLADICFLLFAPLCIIGLLMLAKRPVSRAGWVCLGLDAWLIGGSLVTLSWSLALAHAAHEQEESVARGALALAYPLLDIALVSVVLVLHFRRSVAHRMAINTAIGALALTVVCDALFTSPVLRDQYSSGQMLDAGWFAGSLLLACAPWVVGRSPASAPGAEAEAGGPPEEPPSRPLVGSLAALTPYLAAAVCTLSILITVVGGWQVNRVVVVTACTVVLALLVRQGIMLLDNISLTRELALKESYFRSLVQGSSDVIMIAAPDGRLRYVSPAATGVYGQDANRLIGSDLSALIHPDDVGRVLHELRRFLSVPPAREPATRIECRVRHGGGHWLNVESSVNRYQGGLIFNSRDVTERVQLQVQLQHSASHDALTDLPNRALFTERVRQALNDASGAAPEAAVFFIDLDGFKAVNDSVGHQAGDELLIQAGRRLRESVRAGDTTARLGGDEFAVLVVGDPGQHGAEQSREARTLEVAERVRTALSRPYVVDGREVRVAASLGVAFAEPGSTPAGLMRHADLAMYRAKQAGKARVEPYVPQLQAEAVRRSELADRLRDALRSGEFALQHQPVVDLADGRITAVAAQLRWRAPTGMLATPVEVLRHGWWAPAAPSTGAPPAGEQRCTEVARWLLGEAIAEAARRHRERVTVPVSVQLPTARLVGQSLAAGRLEALLSRHGLPPEALLLELREAEPCLASEEIRRRLRDLSRLGVGIGLDGFGSGGSAVAALHRLPVDLVRLDRELVDGLLESSVLFKITEGLLRVASDLGIVSLADGVDVPEQAAALRAMGCHRGQGLAFCGPLDGTALARALERGRLTAEAGAPAAAPPSAPGASAPAVQDGSVGEGRPPAPVARRPPAAHGPPNGAGPTAAPVSPP